METLESTLLQPFSLRITYRIIFGLSQMNFPTNMVQEEACRIHSAGHHSDSSPFKIGPSLTFMGTGNQQHYINVLLYNQFLFVFQPPGNNEPLETNQIMY